MAAFTRPVPMRVTVEEVGGDRRKFSFVIGMRMTEEDWRTVSGGLEQIQKAVNDLQDLRTAKK